MATDTPSDTSSDMPEGRGSLRRFPTGPRDPYQRRSLSPVQRSDYGRKRDRERVRGREWDDLRDRDRESEWNRGRARSRSPPRVSYDSYRSETYRPSYSESASRREQKDSSSAQSSMTGSPIHASRPDQTNETRILSQHANVKAPEPRLEPLIAIIEPSGPSEKSESINPVHPVDKNTAPQGLIELIQSLAKHSTDVAALKVQRSLTKEDLDDRSADFLKSAPQHEKFPNIKIYQMEAKSVAEKRLKEMDHVLDGHTRDLNLLAAETLQLFAPSAASLAASAKERDEVQELRKLCDTFQQNQKILFEQLKAQAESFEGFKKDARDEKARLERSLEFQTKSNQDLALDLSKFKIEYENTLKESSCALDAFKSEQLLTNARNAKDLKDLQEISKTDSSQIRKDIAQVKESLISIELQPKVQPALSFSDPILSSLSNRMVSMQQSMDISSSKIKTLERAQLELNAVEGKFHSTSTSLNGLIKRVEDAQQSTKSQLEKQQIMLDALPRAITQATIEKFVSDGVKGVETRLSDVETAQRTAKTATQKLDEKIDCCVQAPAAQALSQAIKALEERAAHLEKPHKTQTPRSSPDPSTSLIAHPDLISRINKIEAKVANCEYVIGEVKAGEENVNKSISHTIMTLVHPAIDDEVSPRFEEYDQKIVKLEASITQAIAQQNNEIETAKRNLPEVSASKVIATIQADPSVLPPPRLHQHLPLIQKSLGDLSQEVIALQNGFQNHEARINNISTGQLAKYMLDQLGERFPFDKYHAEVQALQLHHQSLETDLQNLKVHHETVRTDLSSLKDMRQELDNDIRDVTAKSTRTQEVINALDAKVRKNDHTIADKFVEIELKADRIDSLESQVNAQDYNKLGIRLEDIQARLGTQIAIQGKITALETEFTTIRSRLDTFITADKISDLETKIVLISEQLCTAKWSQDISSLDSQIIKLQEQVDELKQTHSQVLPQLREQLEEVRGNQREASKTMPIVPQSQTQPNGTISTALKPTTASAQPDRRSLIADSPKRLSPANKPLQAATVTSGNLAQNTAPSKPRHASPSDASQSRQASATADLSNRSNEIKRIPNSRQRFKSSKTGDIPIQSDLIKSTKKRKHVNGSTPSALKSSRSNKSGPALKKAKSNQGFYNDSDDNEDEDFPVPMLSDGEDDDDDVKFLSFRITGGKEWAAGSRCQKD